jgi:hypothetical protein
MWSQLRQAEIENLGLAARRDKNIRRLDVPMNDAFGVGRIQPVGNLNPELEQRVEL